MKIFENFGGIASLLTALVAVLSSIGAFLGCQTWDSCRSSFSGQSASTTKTVATSSITTARVAVTSLNAELDSLCERREFVVTLYRFSPCRVADFSKENMEDARKVHELSGQIRRHSSEITQSVARLIQRLGQSDELIRGVAETYRDWDFRRARDLELILLEDPSWREINEFRIKSNDALDRALHDIFQKTSLAPKTAKFLYVFMPLECLKIKNLAISWVGVFAHPELPVGERAVT